MVENRVSDLRDYALLVISISICLSLVDVNIIKQNLDSYSTSRALRNIEFTGPFWIDELIHISSFDNRLEAIVLSYNDIL